MSIHAIYAKGGPSGVGSARARADEMRARERRRLPRMRLDHPVSCRAGGKEIQARALCISGEGMLLETELHLTPGSVLEVRIGPPLTPNRPFSAEMRVARVEEITGGGRVAHRIAGSFTRVA